MDHAEGTYSSVHVLVGACLAPSGLCGVAPYSSEAPSSVLTLSLSFVCVFSLALRSLFGSEWNALRGALEAGGL